MGPDELVGATRCISSESLVIGILTIYMKNASLSDVLSEGYVGSSAQMVLLAGLIQRPTQQLVIYSSKMLIYEVIVTLIFRPHWLRLSFALRQYFVCTDLAGSFRAVNMSR